LASFLCKCGKRLSNTAVPNDVELWVYTDREWVQKVESQAVIDPGDFPDPDHDVWRCSECERVYVFRNNRLIKVYVPEG
jgi:hypothetical protein